MAEVDSSQSLSEASKLNGVGKYVVWKFCIKQLLEKEDLWELVEAPPSYNTVLESTVILAASQASGVSSGTVGESSQATRTISSNDNAATLSCDKKKVLALIGLSVKDESISVISMMTDPNKLLHIPPPPCLPPPRSVLLSPSLLLAPPSIHPLKPNSAFTDFFIGLTELYEPQTFAEADAHPGWRAAKASEIHFICQNQMWTLTTLPPGRTPITTRWVYIKSHADGTPAKFKAHLVARGFEQHAGIDYDETFARVAKYNTLRALLALAGPKGWHVQPLDVKTTFLNGFLDKEVYITQPEGIVAPG